MLRRPQRGILVLLALTSGQPVNACVSSNDEQLQTYCLINELGQQPISRETAVAIDQKLKLQGYKNGIGLGFDNQPILTKFGIGATASYDANINGGNPEGPLKIGNLIFETDPNLYQKSGFLIGGYVNLDHRHILSEGKYITFNAGVSYRYNDEHDLGVASQYVTLCSENHVKNWWYINACGARKNIHKKLSDSSTSDFSIQTKKLFKNDTGTYFALQTGIKRLQTNTYNQSQLQLEYQTVNEFGTSLGVIVKLGEDVQDTLALKNSFEMSYTKLFNDKPIEIVFESTTYGGSQLFGTERSDLTQSISISAPLTKRFVVSAGISKTSSSIAYYDNVNPRISFQYIQN